MSGITILGSAYAIASASRENTHLLVRSKTRNILIDCGNNPVGKLELAGMEVISITDLVLTHAHADHMGALPLLLMDMWLRRRQSALTIHGLEYTLEHARRLLEVFHWGEWQNMYPVIFNVIEEKPKTRLIEDECLVVTVSPVQHSIPNICTRIDLLDIQKSIVYSSDTSPCTNLVELATGADVLIQEAAGPGKIHTSPEEAGSMAGAAGVKRLILIHFDPGRPAEDQIAETKRHFSGSVEMAFDLMDVK
jgi:ribonuclease Z